MKKVGEIFDYEGNTLIVVPNNTCNMCIFQIDEVFCKKTYNPDLVCSRFGRSDDTDVIFMIYKPFKFGK